MYRLILQYGYTVLYPWFRVPGRFHRGITSGSRIFDVAKTSLLGHFWPFLWAITHGFGVRGRF